MDSIYRNKQDHSPPSSPTLPPLTVIPLPIECLEIILAYLQHDLGSLYNLLFVSRLFFQLTVPVLYKSPFQLAAIADSVSGGPHIDNSANGWARFLKRTKLLSRLLFQNLQIRPLAPSFTLARSKVSIMDDSVELGHIEPLIPPIESSAGSEQKSTLLISPEAPTSTTITSDDHPSLEDNEDCGENHQSVYNFTDLMTFDDEYPLKNCGSGTSCRLKGDNKTGLLMDYFYFYTHQDHRSIAYIIREIYPGAGRREYDKYLAEIEQAILQHNPSHIESIHIQSASVVIPYLHAHMEQFKRLSIIKLRDPVWTDQELEMVYNFLRDYAAKFPAAQPQIPEDDKHHSHSLEQRQILNLRKGNCSRKAAIRHVKYAASRSQWDNAQLAGKPFDPLQFILALGPGLESIDSIYWYKTDLSQLESLDVRSLQSLRISYLTTPHKDNSFSRPEFLSRCRQLRNLDLFSSSGDMFAWAVTDWNEQKRALTALKSLKRSSQELRLDPNPYPCLEGMRPTGLPQYNTVRPLVRLSRFCIHGPNDDIVFNILRDALYSFRTTLRILEAVSDLEYAAGNIEWLDQAEQLLAGRLFSDFKWKKNTDIQKSKEPKENVTNHESRDHAMDDEDFYNQLSSIAVGSLHIRWEVPCLTDLDLTGSIACVFDVESLQHMPNLRNLSLSITTYTNHSAARYRLYQPNRHASYSDYFRKNDPNEDQLRRCDLTLIPIVASPTLRRVMIRGPWPEITDESLQKMIMTITSSAQSVERTNVTHRDNISVDESEEFTWGNQLRELTILDNPCVTVQRMIYLAQQMDQLQVMGMSLTLSSNNDHHHLTELSPLSNYRRYMGSRYKYMPGYGSSVPHGEDADALARKMILKARIKFPWIDLGPEARHLGRKTRPDGYLSRGWGA
ncbi:hypothetical protein FBU30_010179 [Linnemannia zychae]|nr:hypothetical protein FBU30_010179 [Linnemannia zychae]